MNPITHISSISEIHDGLGIDKPEHPLISVFYANQLKKIDTTESIKFSLGLYHISLKGNCPFAIKNYGRNSYDFQEGTMIFTQPNQVLELQKKEESNDEGWIILFHPDLIRKSELGKNIDNYSFFSYASSEALHLSKKEQQTVTEIVEKMESEFKNNIDAHSQTLIISNLELLLNYCTRFYDRQFYTRTNLNKDIVTQFEQLLKEYYNSDKPLNIGVPTVQYCGEALNFSPKYLSDLLRKETGRNTREHIQHFVINKAKNILLNSNKSVNEIAYDLGFEYPQNFSAMFKKQVKMTPNKFRSLN